MMGFFKKWLKEEFLLFIWGWGCFLLVIFFSIFAVEIFPDVAINLIGMFILFVIAFHIILWFKFKKKDK